MAIAIQYFAKTKPQTVSVLQRNANLPYLSGTNVVYAGWGNSNFNICDLPQDGFCRLEILAKGQWDKWFPKFVLVPAKAFCILNHLGKAHWFRLSTSEYIKAVLATDNKVTSLYVCMQITQRLDNPFWYWPVVVKKPSGMISPSLLT